MPLRIPPLRAQERLRAVGVDLVDLDQQPGYCTSHIRYFWGFRLRALYRIERHPTHIGARLPECVGAGRLPQLLTRVERDGHLIVVENTGYASREFKQAAAELDATTCRLRRPPRTLIDYTA